MQKATFPVEMDFFRYLSAGNSNVNRESWLLERLTAQIPGMKMNKLCFSFHFNEVCRCMWQVNIESLWRNELQPQRSAGRRRLQPNEE